MRGGLTDEFAQSVQDGEWKVAAIIGAHCSSPFPCPYYDHCLAQHPRADYPVELLPNARKTIDALLAEGYRDLREVPAGRIPSPRLERIRRITAAGKAP